MFIAEYKKLEEQEINEEKRVDALGKIFDVRPYNVVVRIQTLSSYLL